MDIVAAEPRGTVVRWAGDGSWAPRPQWFSSVAGYSEMDLQGRRGGDLFLEIVLGSTVAIIHLVADLGDPQHGSPPRPGVAGLTGV